MCKGRKVTCRTRQSHMHFGSPPKCTWLRLFLVANARVSCSVEARRGCGRPEKQPPCILAEHLNARILRLPSLGWAFTRRFEHAQTGSSQPSRMRFSTDSKRICSPHSGLGVWGHVGHLHGDLGTHKPLRHNRHEYISARILNAFAPRTRVWECGAMLGFYTAIWARTNPFVTTLTNAIRHGF